MTATPAGGPLPSGRRSRRGGAHSLARLLVCDLCGNALWRRALTGARPLPELEQAAATVRARLAVAGAVVARPDPAVLASAADRLEQLWPEMTPGEKRAALGSVVSQIRVRPAVHRRQPLDERVDVLDPDGGRLR